MARALHNKSNVESPSSDYPYGRVKDKVANLTAGTPINEAVYGDFHQFFSRLMAQAEIEENGNPDNDYSGFQLHQALLKTIRLVMSEYANTEDISATSTNLNNYIHAGLFTINLYTHSNGPSTVDDDAQLIVTGFGSSVIQRVVHFDSGAEWVRYYNGSTFTPWTLVRFGIKEVAIGFWDMDASISVNVPHGIANVRKIKTVQAYIFNDAGSSQILNLYGEVTGSGSVGGNVYAFSALNVTLVRTTGGIFDDAAYNDGTINRGFMVIQYEP